MDDLISRQAAIDAIEKYDFSFPEYMERFVTELRDAIKEDLKDDIANLPSAQPEQRWIPCGERLPSERQDVYVTVLWDDYGDYITAYGMRTQFGWNLYSNAEGELIKGYTVVAWMPLPTPYREENEE